jgi:hypothetical protein
MKKTLIVCFAAALTLGSAIAQDKMAPQEKDKMSDSKDAKKKAPKKKAGDKMDKKDDGKKMDDHGKM